MRCRAFEPKLPQESIVWGGCTPPASFDAVISFYTLEHIPREEHRTILRRIYHWLRVGGFLLLSIEAGDYDDVLGEWLGVPMFISCFDPDMMK